MARLVAAFGSSHSIMLTTSLEDWQVRFRERDKEIHLIDHEGDPIAWDEAVKSAPANAAELIKPERIAERFANAHAMIAKLKGDIAAAELDALIVVGDDQYELFQDVHMPSIAIYYGDKIRNAGRVPVPEAEWYRRGMMGYRDDTETSYPCDGALARHLIDGLMQREFDISTSNSLGKLYEGHAFSFIHRAYLAERPVPIVPVFLNTYYPPNPPTPKRCVALGKAIAELVGRYPGDARIGILGSGGLSHFLIDEALDTDIVEAFRRNDIDRLAALEPRRLRSGTSEIRNWIVMAAAAAALKLDWISYIPGYRSPALTGTGLCFARWS